MSDGQYSISLKNVVIYPAVEKMIEDIAPLHRLFVVVSDAIGAPGRVLYECTQCLSRFQFNLFTEVEREEVFDAHSCWISLQHLDIDWAADLGVSPEDLGFAIGRDMVQQMGRQMGRQIGKTNIVVWGKPVYKGKMRGRTMVSVHVDEIADAGVKPNPAFPAYERFTLDEVTDYDTLTKLLPPGHDVSEPPVVEYFRKPPLDMHLVMSVKINTLPFSATYTLTTEEVFPREGHGDVRDNMAAAMECLLKDIGYAVRRSFDGR